MIQLRLKGTERNVLVLCILWTLSLSVLFAEGSKKDSSRFAFPFIQLGYQPGYVLPTNDFARGDYPGGKALGVSHSVSLQFGWHHSPQSWRYAYYGEQAQGVGLRFSAFGDARHLGSPFTLYYFQSGNLHTFSSRLHLVYEADLGLTMGWKRYDESTGYWNDATGGFEFSTMIEAAVLLSWRLSPQWEAQAGVGVSHFSNGAFALPNMGLNQFEGRAALKYYFRPRPFTVPSSGLILPPYQRGIEWDLTFVLSKRQRYLKDAPYADIIKFDGIDYAVAIANVAALFRTGRLCRVGPVAELMYDESCGVDLWLSGDQSRVEHSLAPFFHRFNAGVGVRAELLLPGLSFWTQFGVNLLHQTVDNERFSQIVGMRCPLSSRLSLTGGVRACNFKVAQCMFVGVQVSLGKKNDSYL